MFYDEKSPCLKQRIATFVDQKLVSLKQRKSKVILKSLILCGIINNNGYFRCCVHRQATNIFALPVYELQGFFCYYSGGIYVKR